MRQVKNCQDFTYKDKIDVLLTQVYRLCLCKFTDSVYTGLQILFTQVYRFCLYRFMGSVYTGLQVLF